MRVDGIANIAGLLHQNLIDTQATCGIDNHHIVAMLASISEATERGVNWVVLAGAHFMGGIEAGARERCEARHACTLSHDFQLLHRTWALQVAGDENWGVPLIREVPGQFTGQGGLTSTLQTGQHDNRWRLLRHIETSSLATEDVDQFLIDNLNDLVGRVDRLAANNFVSAFLDALDEGTDNLEGDIGFQKSQPNLAGGGVNIRLSQATLPAQPPQGTRQTIGKRLKQVSSSPFALSFLNCSTVPAGYSVWHISIASPIDNNCIPSTLNTPIQV